MSTTAAGLASIPGVNLIPQGQTEGRDRGRWLIHGEPGSGKTTLASTVAKMGKTLFLDMVGEKGTRSFQGAPYADRIQVARPTSITALDDLYWWLAAGDHDFDAVVVDSLTSVQKMTMRYLLKHDETAVREIQQGTAPADMRTWGEALNVMQDLGTFWFGLADGDRARPMHVVMTAQTKLIENELAGVEMRVPDVQKGAINGIVANADYVLYTEAEDNLDAVNDDDPPTRYVVRFGSHPGYRTKARVPQNLRGKVPHIIGRGKNGPDLFTLSRVLQIGGVPATKKKAATAATQTPATATNTKEN